MKDLSRGISTIGIFACAAIACFADPIAGTLIAVVALFATEQIWFKGDKDE